MFIYCVHGIDIKTMATVLTATLHKMASKHLTSKAYCL